MAMFSDPKMRVKVRPELDLRRGDKVIFGVLVFVIIAMTLLMLAALALGVAWLAKAVF